MPSGVKIVQVLTMRCDREGTPNLVERCSYPLTGARVVDRVYTDPSVIDITDNGFEVIKVSPWTCFYDVVARTSAPLRNASLESIPQDELSPFTTVAPAISKAL